MENQENSDTVKLMTSFPNEIWLSVLNHVDNFTDYLHICGSSSFLKTTFQTLRTKVLFADVLKILQECGKDETQVLSIEELLSLRLVCSSWKNGVDKRLQHLSGPYIIRRLSPVFFKASDFPKYKEPFSGNPFLTRAVSIFTPPPFGDPSIFYSELISMLRNFGKQIWYCEMKAVIENTEEQITFFNRIRTILELMPNLRRLEFSSGVELDVELVLPEEHFPTLKRLEAVNERGMPALVFQKLVQRNLQITHVQSGNLTSELLHFFLKKMPNLKDLSMNIVEMDHFNQFCDSTMLCCLTKLDIDLKSLESSWECVFSALESKFKEILQDLVVLLPNPKFYTEGCSLSLPNLKVLTVFLQHPANLDFTLPMKRNLENLNIVCEEGKNLDLDFEASTLDVFKCGENLHKSNIWELFTNFKCLDVELDSNLKYTCTTNLWKQQKTQHWSSMIIQLD